MRVFALGQTTKFGQHTVARVLANDLKEAEKLFLDYYRKAGFPSIRRTPKSRIGLEVGTIMLDLYEGGRPDLHKLKPRTVTPITAAAPHKRQHAGLVLGEAPPKKRPRPKPARNLVEPTRDPKWTKFDRRKKRHPKPRS